MENKVANGAWYCIAHFNGKGFFFFLKKSSIYKLKDNNV